MPVPRQQSHLPEWQVANIIWHQLHWGMKRKIHPDRSLTLSMLHLLQFYSLFIDRRFVQGRGFSQSLRVVWDVQSSQMSTFSLCVISQQGLVRCLVSQPAGNCCVWTPLCWWQHPLEVYTSGRVMSGKGGSGTLQRSAHEGYFYLRHTTFPSEEPSHHGLYRLALTNTSCLTRFRTRKWFAV